MGLINWIKFFFFFIFTGFLYFSVFFLNGENCEFYFSQRLKMILIWLFIVMKKGLMDEDTINKLKN